MPINLYTQVFKHSDIVFRTVSFELKGKIVCRSAEHPAPPPGFYVVGLAYMAPGKEIIHRLLHVVKPPGGIFGGHPLQDPGWVEVS